MSTSPDQLNAPGAIMDSLDDYYYPDTDRRRTKTQILSEQQNHRCCYCGVRFVDELRHPDSVTIEHVIALSNRGPRTWDNEVAACKTCNSRRGNMPADVFFEQREAIFGGHGQRHGRGNRRRVRQLQLRAADPRLLVLVHEEAGSGTLADVWPSDIGRRVARDLARQERRELVPPASI